MIEHSGILRLSRISSLSTFQCITVDPDVKRDKNDSQPRRRRSSNRRLLQIYPTSDRFLPRAERNDSHNWIGANMSRRSIIGSSIERIRDDVIRAWSFLKLRDRDKRVGSGLV